MSASASKMQEARDRAKMMIKALGFNLIEDHVFSSNAKGKEVEEMMRKDSENKKKMQKLLEDHPNYFRLIPTSKGFGLEAAKDIPQGTAIMMYFGKVTLDKDRDQNSEYILQVPHTRYFVDSKYEGNFARFINHSCVPNCSIDTRWYKDRCYPVIVAKRYIAEGSELTYDYNYQIRKGAKNFKCQCGAGGKCRYMCAKQIKSNICGLRYWNVKGVLVLKDKECMKQYTNNTEMYNHRFSEHYAGGVLKCYLCGSKYKTYNSLKAHVNKNHKDKKGTQRNDGLAESVKYPCSYCNECQNFSPTEMEDHLIECKKISEQSTAKDSSNGEPMPADSFEELDEDKEDEELEEVEENEEMEEEEQDEEMEEEEDEDVEVNADEDAEEEEDEDDKNDMDWDPASVA